MLPYLSGDLELPDSPVRILLSLDGPSPAHGLSPPSSSYHHAIREIKLIGEKNINVYQFPIRGTWSSASVGTASGDGVTNWRQKLRKNSRIFMAVSPVEVVAAKVVRVEEGRRVTRVSVAVAGRRTEWPIARSTSGYLAAWIFTGRLAILMYVVVPL